MVKLALSGGVIRGNFGSYQAGSDGTALVDSRDAAQLIAAGNASWLTNRSSFYTTPKAPTTANLGQIIASGALSNGTIAVSNQPDVMRQVNAVWGTGTAAINAGNLAITYRANDGQNYTENVALALGANGVATHPLSRGVIRITPPVVSGLVGGTSPYVRFDTTTSIAVPVDPAAQDYATSTEAVDGTNETGGWSDSAVSIGCVAPNTVPNGTHNYSLFYSFVAPVV